MKKQIIKNDYRYETHTISTIIPAYNAEKSICDALDAIRKQDVKDVQIIVIDDGSTDKTAFEVLSYMDRNTDMDILYILQENSGPGTARNTGLEYADGKYICFLDADDFIPKHAYKQYLYVANKWDCDVVIGSYMRCIDGEKWYIPQYISNLCKDHDGENLAGDYMVTIKNPSLWNRMYRREFLNENSICFLNENHGEDLVFNLDVVKHANSIYTTDSVCYYYSKREKGRNSVSTSWSFKNTASRIRAISTYMMYFDGLGNVYEEMVYIRTEIEYLMPGLRSIADKDERNQLYEMFMKELSRYLGNKKYETFIGMLLGVDLELAVLIPFDAYLMYKQMLWTEKDCTSPVKMNNPNPNQNGNTKDIVLSQFEKGQIGFRYIVKYFKAWLKFKLFH